MNIIQKATKFITDPAARMIFLSSKGFYRNMPDDKYLSILFKKRVGYELNLDEPKTFNEKLQWLKLYDRNPEYTTMVDKYAVKKLVADRIGEEYIIPTFGVWDNFDDIDFNLLPNKFVLKCTHDSGGLVIVKDKRKFDKAMAKKKLEKSLKRNYYWPGREWPYKNVLPRIIAEEYMEDRGRIVPEDYKVYCMNGEPKYIVVFHNRFDDTKELSETVYDINWNKQEFSFDEHFAISNIIEPKPRCLNELIKLAKKLCEGMAQVRVDFYIINEKIYFGEITLYTASGFQKMIPEEKDFEMGKLINLTSDFR